MTFIECVHDMSLGHASHLVGDEDAGVAVVVDPARDPAPYLRLAAERGVRIEWVLDTHAHNDYLSGVQALATHGARAIAPVGASTGYAAEPAWHWRRIQLGALELELLHTPGHTPEHTSVLVHGVGGTGLTLLSGGSLLIGDVGRPDLLGDNAQQRAAARAMVHSMLEVLLDLPDTTEVRPTHVGGSLCAGAISPGLLTTIGEQRRENPALLAMQEAPDDLDAWFEPALLPPVPPSWPATRARNLAGAGRPGTAPDDLESLSPAQLLTIAPDTLVLDVRDAYERSAIHLLDSVHIPLSGSFTTWVGIAAHGARDVVLVARDARHAQAAAEAVARVHPRGVAAWLPEAHLTRLPADLLGQGGDARPSQLVDDVTEGRRTLLDVRNPAELRDRPVHGAIPIPATRLLTDPAQAPSGPLAICCASGYRARVVASALRRAGHADVVAIEGDPFEARWRQAHARDERAPA